METKSRLGNLLVKKGVIDKQTLEKALIIQAEEADDNLGLPEILVRHLGISHNLVYGQLAEFYAFRTTNIEPEKLSDQHIQNTKDLLKKFPDKIKNKLLYKKVLPYQFALGKSLLVLAADVTEKAIELIPNNTEFKKYEIIYCPLNILEDIIQKVAPQKNEFLELLNEQVQQVDDTITIDQNKLDETALDDEINKSLLVNLFEGSIIEGVRQKASDIHILPSSRLSVDFCFRIDGKLKLWHRQDNTSPEAMSAVVKDRSQGVDRFERDTAQDGFTQRVIDGHLIRLRVSIMPLTASEYDRNFESIVIRIIDDRNVITDLASLGFQAQPAEDFKKAISSSKGLVLLTGPTGSGKSTTLMAALHHVIDPSLNVLTCEDPVEYVIKGARQIKIGNKLSFDEAIRSILRHDPDIVMVGEIRDKETAEVAVKLSNTGHLTFSTLHTNDAVSAVSRLYKMGIETFLLANVINIIVAQRLIRRLCPHCKVTASHQTIDLMRHQNLEFDKTSIYEANPKGCKQCNNGYKGRISVTEALYFTKEIKHEILSSGDEINEENIKEIAVNQGMLTLAESAFDRVKTGHTSFSEVSHIVYGS